MITDKHMDLYKEMKSIKIGYYYVDKQKKDKIEVLKIFISPKVSRRKREKEQRIKGTNKKLVRI